MNQCMHNESILAYYDLQARGRWLCNLCKVTRDHSLGDTRLLRGYSQKTSAIWFYFKCSQCQLYLLTTPLQLNAVVKSSWANTLFPHICSFRSWIVSAAKIQFLTANSGAVLVWALFSSSAIHFVKFLSWIRKLKSLILDKKTGKSDLG